jgi:repressor LexA
MAKRIPPTSRQKEILDFIRDYHATAGYMPTLREIMRAFRFGSTNAAVCHLDALEAKGYIERDSQVARGMRLL